MGRIKKPSSTTPDIIDICHGDDDSGAEVYVCLRVSFDRYEEYKAAVFSGYPFNPHDYGEIIASGAGHPPDSLLTDLKKQYSLIEDFEA